MKKIIAGVVLLVALAVVASAQAPATAAREDLSGLPESQAVLYVNARRITNEALPALVPASKYQPMFDEAKKINVDVRQIDYVLAGVRYTGAPSSGFGPVEFGVIVRGGFNADGLVSFARLSEQGKYREEAHAGKTVSIFRTDSGGEKKDDAPGAQPKPPEEIAAVTLGPDALLIGTPAYVAAALDARGGAGARIRTDLVDLALRDSSALVSLAGDLPPSLSKYLDPPGGAGAEMDWLFNDETRRLVDSLRQVQLSLSLAAARYSLQTALRADTPENARAVSGFIATLLDAAQDDARKDAALKGRAPGATDAQALALLKSITNTVEGDDVLLTVSAPQTTVASFLRDAIATPPARRAAPRTNARPATRRRAPARRRG